jgi:hypothetical protein
MCNSLLSLLSMMSSSFTHCCKAACHIHIDDCINCFDLSPFFSHEWTSLVLCRSVHFVLFCRICVSYATTYLVVVVCVWAGLILMPYIFFGFVVVDIYCPISTIQIQYSTIQIQEKQNAYTIQYNTNTTKIQNKIIIRNSRKTNSYRKRN